MKWRNIILISISELLAKSLWFSASTVVPQLTILWALTASQQTLITGSVQLGFVIGAFLSAFFNLADRMDNRYFFAICAVATAMFNAAIPALHLGFEKGDVRAERA